MEIKEQKLKSNLEETKKQYEKRNGNKIIVEFDRKELDSICAKKCQWYKLCIPKDENYIKCNLRYDINFKIKEQNNGNKGTEN